MKEKIKNILQQIPQNKKILITASLALLSIVAVPTVYGLTAVGQTANAAEQNIIQEQGVTDSRIGVVGAESATSTGNAGPGNSWPGELVSSEISQIQPQREGVMVEWRVRVGQQVSAGQVLGKISAPPATPELIKMLSEQTEAVTRARAQAVIADKYASTEQARFSALRDSISSGANTNTDLSFTAFVR